MHDSQVFEELLDDDNSSRDVYADSAYRTPDNLKTLKKNNFREHTQRKGCRNRKLTTIEKKGNRTRSRIRSRVEHVFGIQSAKAWNMVLHGVGIVRNSVKIGLRNLAYNISRFVMLKKVSYSACQG